MGKGTMRGMHRLRRRLRWLRTRGGKKGGGGDGASMADSVVTKMPQTNDGRYDGTRAAAAVARGSRFTGQPGCIKVSVTAGVI